MSRYRRSVPLFILLILMLPIGGSRSLDIDDIFGSVEDHSILIDIPSGWGPPSQMVQDQDGELIYLPFFSYQGSDFTLCRYNVSLGKPEVILSSSGIQRTFREELFVERGVLEGSQGSDILLRDDMGSLFGITFGPILQGAKVLGYEDIIYSGLNGTTAIGDVTGDDKMDLLHLSPDGTSLELYEGPLPSKAGKAVLNLPAPMDSIISGMDLTGDGISEVVLWKNDGNRTRVLIYYGHTLTPMALAEDDLEIGSIAHGDIDGNGLDDLFIQHLKTPTRGEIKVLFGETISSGMDLRTDGWDLIGNETYNITGSERIALRDLNGDGLDDLIIGAPDEGSGRGRTMFINGGPFWDRRYSGRSILTDAELQGSSVSGRLGSGLYIADDLDNDLLPDILVMESDGLLLIEGSRNGLPSDINNPGFEDANGNDKTTAELGETVYLRCVASGGRNRSVDTLKARVHTIRDEHSTSTWIHLQETGPSTAVYKGALLLGTASIPGRSLGVVQNDRIAFDINGISGNDLLVKGVKGQEDPPFFLEYEDDVTVFEDEELEIGFRALDPDTGSVNWSFEDLPEWLNTFSEAFSEGSDHHLLRGIPDNGDIGWNNFTVTISADSLHTSIDVSVYVVNKLPLIVPRSVAMQAWEGSSYVSSFSLDEDGGSLSTSITMLGPVEDTWLTIFNNGTVTGMPRNRHVGNWTVNLTLDDGNGGIDWFVWKISVINEDPVVIVPEIENWTEYEPLLIDLECIDEGDGMTFFTLRYSSQPVNLDIFNGTIESIPTIRQSGRDLEMTVIVMDIHGGETEVTIEIDLKAVPPTLVPPELPEILFAGEIYDLDFDSNEEGPDGAYSLNTPPGSMMLFFNGGTTFGLLQRIGKVHLEPWNEHVGNHSMTISIRDPWDGTMTSLTWNFTVVGNTSFVDPYLDITFIRQNGKDLFLDIDIESGRYSPVRLVVQAYWKKGGHDNATYLNVQDPVDGQYVLDISPFNDSVFVDFYLDVRLEGGSTRSVYSNRTFAIPSEVQKRDEDSFQYGMAIALLAVVVVAVAAALLFIERTSFALQSALLKGGQVREKEVLALIHDRPGISFRELSASLDVERRDLVATIDSLESEGMARAVDDGLKVRFWPMMGAFVDGPLVFNRYQEKVLEVLEKGRRLSLQELSDATGFSKRRLEKELLLLELKGSTIKRSVNESTEYSLSARQRISMIKGHGQR